MKVYLFLNLSLCPAMRGSTVIIFTVHTCVAIKFLDKQWVRSSGIVHRSTQGAIKLVSFAKYNLVNAKFIV